MSRGLNAEKVGAYRFQGKDVLQTRYHVYVDRKYCTCIPRTANVVCLGGEGGLSGGGISSLSSFPLRGVFDMFKGIR